jgi:hypothetical protein
MHHLEGKWISARRVKMAQDVTALRAGCDDGLDPCPLKGRQIETVQFAVGCLIPCPIEVVSTTPLVRQNHGLDTQRVEDPYRGRRDLPQLHVQVREEIVEIGDAADEIECLPVRGYLEIGSNPIQTILGESLSGLHAHQSVQGPAVAHVIPRILPVIEEPHGPDEFRKRDSRRTALSTQTAGKTTPRFLSNVGGVNSLLDDMLGHEPGGEITVHLGQRAGPGTLAAFNAVVDPIFLYKSV